jgi:hypothetical protein
MVDNFLRKAKEFVLGPDESQSDPNSELRDRNVRPASEDPHGDPADPESYHPRPASEDPYGDPADPASYHPRPASEDPSGDPADQEVH